MGLPMSVTPRRRIISCLLPSIYWLKLSTIPNMPSTYLVFPHLLYPSKRSNSLMGTSNGRMTHLSSFPSFLRMSSQTISVKVRCTAGSLSTHGGRSAVGRLHQHLPMYNYRMPLLCNDYRSCVPSRKTSFKSLCHLTYRRNCGGRMTWRWRQPVCMGGSSPW
jgi:hypothetical protein